MDNNDNFDVTKHIHCDFINYSTAFREIVLENNKLDFFCLLVYSLSQQNLAESKHNGLSLCSYVLCQGRKTGEVGSMRGALTWIVRSSLSHSCVFCHSVLSDRLSMQHSRQEKESSFLSLLLFSPSFSALTLLNLFSYKEGRDFVN